MARPRKSRKVCHFPQSLAFAPAAHGVGEDAVVLTVDEYETIRLIDLEDFSQEACGEWMGIARTTVQMIYTSARKKLAQMLVEGRPLEIAGGDYRLCDGARNCSQALCFKQYYSRKYEKPTDCVRVAVSCNGGEISQGFEEVRQIHLYDLREGKIIGSQILDVAQTDQVMLPGIPAALQTDLLVCNTIGSGTKLALNAAGIRVIAGISGDADGAVRTILEHK